MNKHPGPLLVDIDGTTLAPEDLEILRHPLVGGVILFSRNYENPRQLAELVAAIQMLRNPRLLVTVDHEGGRVQRFREGFTRLPPARAIGYAFERNQSEGLALARTAGWMMAAELRAVGVDLSFAPVLDLDAGISEVIGDRAFHIQPQAVAALAGAYAKGMAEAGMAACGKHFPGHGNVAGDSHLQLPVDTREMETIGAADLIPFRASITAGIPALMMAHVRYEGVDPEPASLSAHWIRGILRGEFAFNGVVFCDDLSMNGAAAAGSYFERATLALRAGCDVLPVCNNRAAVAELLDTDLPAPPSGPAHWNRLFGRKAPNWDGLHNSELWGKSVQTLGVV